MNVAVIYGGKSGEHEVSIISATSIVRNLSQDKYTVFLIGITKDGRWFFQNPSQVKEVCENPDALLRREENKESAVSLVPGGGTKGGIATARGSIAIDIAFIVLHGTYGEDGTIQGLFDMLAIPYTGCGTMSSSLAMDKEKTKIVWQSNNLPVLPHVCLHKDEMTKNTAAYNALIKKAEDNFGYPLFVKPCSAGSSCGATKATTSKELYKALKEAFSWDNKILIEPAVNVREIECSVTGNKEEDIKAYIPGEITPSHEFYDYDAKYLDPQGAVLTIPADVSSDQREQIRTLAVQAYKALDCTGLSRVDFFIDKDSGELYLNEVNTMPGFTSISMFPKMCQAGGLDYTDLLDLLIELGLKRFEDKNSLQTSR